MAKIVDITKDGQSVYPRTIADAVAVSGKVLTDALEAKAEKSDLESLRQSVQLLNDKLTQLLESFVVTDGVLNLPGNSSSNQPSVQDGVLYMNGSVVQGVLSSEGSVENDKLIL